MSPIELGHTRGKKGWGRRWGKTDGIGVQQNLKDSEAPHAIVVTVGTQVANDTLLLQYPQLCFHILVLSRLSRVLFWARSGRGRRMLHCVRVLGWQSSAKRTELMGVVSQFAWPSPSHPPAC